MGGYVACSSHWCGLLIQAETTAKTLTAVETRTQNLLLPDPVQHQTLHSHDFEKIRRDSLRFGIRLDAVKTAALVVAIKKLELPFPSELREAAPQHLNKKKPLLWYK